jgi:hypothetical protein
VVAGGHGQPPRLGDEQGVLEDRQRRPRWGDARGQSQGARERGLVDRQVHRLLSCDAG